MEPQRPNVAPIPEQQPDELMETSPQEALNVEQHEQVLNPEIAPGALQDDNQSPVILPPVIDDIPDNPAMTADNAATDINAPAIADDVDVIEKEWVDRAKKILHETKDDPHAQEEAIEKLQIEYLRKRYGKEIKSSESA